ncbi:MAG: signal peptidase I [Dehalococcoidia bacterium]
MVAIKNFKELIKTILYALILLGLLQILVKNFEVEGPSMEPTLIQSERIFVNQLMYHRIDLENLSRFVPFFRSNGYSSPFGTPNRGDIIIFEYPPDPSKMFVKRVIGLPGDIIEIDNGIVYLNNEKLLEPYLTNSYSGQPIGPITVENNTFFVLGDNRAESNDSRNGWLVPYENILGKAWILYWPINKLSLI